MSSNMEDSCEPCSSEEKQKVSRYLVQYENNGSKRWDGKVLSLEGEWLESLYQPNELVIGSKLKLPWSGKGGKITNWNAVVVDPNSTTTAQGMVNGYTHAVLAYYTNLGKGKKPLVQQLPRKSKLPKKKDIH